MSQLIFLFISAALLNITGNTLWARPANEIRVLLVTGSDVLKYQISLVHTDFYSMLSSHDDIVWDHAVSDEGAFHSDICNKYDLLILFNFNDALSRDAKINLAKFVESGKGLICFHSHLASYNDWDWWWRNVTGAKYQYHEIGGMKKSGFKQNVPINFIPDCTHPITSAVGEFQVVDEVYSQMYFAEKIQVLYRTDNPDSDTPVVWLGPHTKSRVVSIAQGHGPSIFSNIKFRELFYQSIKWASSKQ